MRHYDANNFVVKTREQGSGFVADWRCRSCSSNGTTCVQLSEDRAELIAKLLAGMHDCPNAMAGDSAIHTKKSS